MSLTETGLLLPCSIPRHVAGNTCSESVSEPLGKHRNDGRSNRSRRSGDLTVQDAPQRACQSGPDPGLDASVGAISPARTPCPGIPRGCHLLRGLLHRFLVPFVPSSDPVPETRARRRQVLLHRGPEIAHVFRPLPPPVLTLAHQLAGNIDELDGSSTRTERLLDQTETLICGEVTHPWKISSSPTRASWGCRRSVPA